ncbi:hypothetical protein V1477_017877 [Vespula maculifrons]|uniref:Uncharacterized protein n=1 Tax=Vespula maculifrons TaxID=7453 RepID=A0ABD2AZL2_VESMC
MHVGEGDPFILLSERIKGKVNLTVDKIAFEKTRRCDMLRAVFTLPPLYSFLGMVYVYVHDVFTFLHNDSSIFYE